VCREIAQLGQPFAQQLYRELTDADDYPGTWEPDDTGSDGRTLGKVLTRRGLIAGYQHITDPTSFLAALQLRAVAFGLKWRSGCDSPNATGLVRWTGAVRGGHEVTAYRYDADRQWVGFRNHWGDWGVGGSFWMTIVDVAAALQDQGDATLLVPNTHPAPLPTPPGDVDTRLAAAFRDWRKGVVSKVTKSGKLAAAGDAWLTEHHL
jgi:hypothetical protein